MTVQQQTLRHHSSCEATPPHSLSFRDHPLSWPSPSPASHAGSLSPWPWRPSPLPSLTPSSLSSLRCPTNSPSSRTSHLALLSQWSHLTPLSLWPASPTPLCASPCAWPRQAFAAHGPWEPLAQPQASPALASSHAQAHPATSGPCLWCCGGSLLSRSGP